MPRIVKNDVESGKKAGKNDALKWIKEKQENKYFLNWPPLGRPFLFFQNYVSQYNKTIKENNAEDFLRLIDENIIKDEESFKEWKKYERFFRKEYSKGLSQGKLIAKTRLKRARTRDLKDRCQYYVPNKSTLYQIGYFDGYNSYREKNKDDYLMNPILIDDEVKEKNTFKFFPEGISNNSIEKTIQSLGKFEEDWKGIEFKN